MTERYAALPAIARQIQAKTIVEIGTWNGVRATEMAREALAVNKQVHYWGFDLFEDATAKTDAREFNVKKHYKLWEVEKRLDEFARRITWASFSYRLIRGDTRQTLPRAKDMHRVDGGGRDKPLCRSDMAFIDGGHSIKTIESDYNVLKECPVIVFDDYYFSGEKQKTMPDITKVGCNDLIKKIRSEKPRTKKVTILDYADPIVGGGFVTLVVVRDINESKFNLKEISKLAKVSARN